MKAVTKEKRRVAYPLALIFLLLAAGIATATTGLLALLGWVLDLPRLASFGADLIPMAPSTALLFLLYGVAVCLRARLPLSHRTFRISVAMVGLGTMVALLLFTLDCLNIHWKVEHLGLSISRTVGEVPIGHMSPVAAFCFLLASVSFLASLSQSATRPWRAVLALGSAGVLVGTCCIFLLAYFFGAPLLYGGTFIPLALNTALAFVMLGLALLALAGWQVGLFGGLPGDGSRTAFAFAMIFVLLAAGIVTVSYRSYRNYERNYYTAAEHQLAAIAELKVGELVQWRKERLWDASAFLNNDAFSVLVKRFLEHPEDVDAQWQIQEWAGKFMATDQYDHVRLLDAQGVTRLSSPVGLPPVSSVVSQRIPEILRTDQVTIQDFHRNEQDQRVYLNIMVPIFEEQHVRRPLGVFYLRIDPDKYLYPFIKHWPTASQTAETLLIRRDGKDALYLNDLRYRTNAALNLRIPLEQINVPAVGAVLGQTGIMQGVDYRGVPVIAAVRAVSDSPWFLVAKMDTAEVYAPLRERLRLTVLLVSLLLIGAGLGIGVFWRHQRVQFYKERYKTAEALREGEARYRAVVDSANDAIVTINTAGEITGWNGAAQRIFHYTAAEMLGQPLVRILPRAGRNHFFTDLQRIQAGGSPLTLDKAMELAGQRKDGSVFPMEISVAEWRVSGERFFTGTMRDITARRQVEVARRENEERLRSHTDNSPLAVVEWNADFIITRWTGAAEKIFGWGAEEAIGKPITELPGICEEDLPIVQSAIQQLADGVSKHVVSSNRNRTRNGQVIHCEWHNSVLHDVGGKMTSVLSQVLDITERKRVEETIARERQLLRTLIDLLPETFFVKDLDGRFLVVNEALAKQYGKDAPSQVLGLSDADLFPAGLAAGFRAEEMKVFAGEPIINHESSAVFLDGRKHTVLTTKLPFRDSQGRICGLVGIGQDITERKQAAEALRESQALYHSLVEQLPVGIFRKDPAGRYVLVNPWFCRFKGMKAEEFLGKMPEEVAASEVAKKDSTGRAVKYAAVGRDHHGQIMQTGKSIELVEEYTDAGGRKQFVHAIKLPVFDLGGKVIGTQGILSDITEIKRAEEALANERALLRTLVDNLPVAFYMKDLAGRKTLVNRVELDYVGAASEAEVLGKTDFDFFSPEQAAVYHATDQEIIRTGQPVINRESSFTKPDGSVIYLLGSVVPVRDVVGRVTGLAGITFDITDRKRAEEALANERALLRALVDNLPLAVYVVDLDGRRTLANPLELDYIGVTSEAEVLGKTAFDLFPPEVAAAYRADDIEVIRSGRPAMNREGSFTKPDGSVLWLLASKVPLRDSAGRVTGLLGINYDITDRKRAEERLLKVITQTRCILYSGHVTGPKDWRKRAVEPVSPFHWDAPVVNEQTAQKVVPLELAAGEHYLQAWERSWYRADAAQMNWNSGNAFLNDLPFYRNEFRCTDKHGVGHWIQEIVTVQKLAENRWQIFSIATDISDLKRVETELRESQALYHSLVDQMTAGVFRKDANGCFIFVNSEFCRLKEMSPEQFLGKTVLEVGLKDSPLAARSAGHHATIMQSGNRIEEDEVFLRADGETRNYHCVKSPVFDSAGTIVGTQGILFDITDRKRAEEALRLNEERLFKVIMQTRCIMHSGRVEGPEGWRERALDPDSPFRWDFPMQNEEAAQKVVPLELAPGERYLEAWIRSRNQADRTQMNWISGNAFLNDLPFYRNEFRCIDKYGVGHWMQEFVTIRKLAVNRWEVFSIAMDISDLKRVETELRRSETGLQATLESTADGILAVDNKGKVIKANRRFAELWQIPQSLMDAGDDHALLDFVLKQLSDPDAFLKKVQLLYNTDMVEMDTLVFKDGRIFERFTSPMMMEGAVIGRVWSFRDITERKQAAQRVADALNFNQTVLRTSPVGIVVFKASGPCLSANEAIGQTLGGTPEEVLKQNFRQLESWKRSGMLAAAEAALAAQAERGLETQLVTTFGKKVWLSCRFAPFPYEGEPHLLLLIGDITERKRQEEELKQKNSELERFTYTVSHDLKSPLVTVKTFLGYLEQDVARPDMERVKQDVAYMHTATERMGQLLDELLKLARVGRKKNPAVRVTFRELAQEAVQLVAGRISTGGVKVQVADAVVTLEGDHPRLIEIWQNLVENACKFMGNQPQPQVEIGVERRGPETVFFVRDNGAGIDPRYQAKVFGLFEQLNPKGEGTGMGLALVKRIVELYEGRIWVESAGTGQGANFLFTLPAAVILEPGQLS